MINSDIKYYHSGGTLNNDPDLDLGGEISENELGTSVENLFNTLTSSESRIGLVDYRCFYIKNTHNADVLRNAKLYVHSERGSGSFIDLGVGNRDAYQTVRITGDAPPNEGEFLELYINRQPIDTPILTIFYHPNPTIWQGRFQTELRGIDSCRDAIVHVRGNSGTPMDLTFDVYFTKSIGCREISMLVYPDTNLANWLADNSNVEITSVFSGKPINTDAVVIADVTTAPAAIDFIHPLVGSPVFLGDLRPGDYFPVWVRRTTPADTITKILDNFKIHIDGEFP